jgi:glutamate-1-semialdehyde 2,1-aminomutase
MSDSRRTLVERAREVLPGGALGSFVPPDGRDIVATRGAGAYLYDTDGRAYIDYILGSGPMILGHAHPAVVAAVQTQLARGSQFYVVNDSAIALAEQIIEATGWAQMLKFTSSGSEATYFALRLARAVTGRSAILKFEGAYHGHHDYAMMSTTPVGATPFPAAVPDTAGIPDVLRDEVLVAPFNDLAATREILETHRHRIAAVIVEPVCRLIEPRPGFLQGLREATRRLGMLLVFDEVVTGFRLAYGGSRALYGVTPDLICFGKAIGGGFPLAAVAGSRELLEYANPRKRGPNYVYISGTLNGNPVAAAAGLATLAELRRPGTYERLNASGEHLRKEFKRLFDKFGISAQVLGSASMLNFYCTPTRIDNYRSARTENRDSKAQIGRELLLRGVLTNLATKIYLSVAHTDEALSQTVAAFAEALQTLSGSRAS